MTRLSESQSPVESQSSVESQLPVPPAFVDRHVGPDNAETAHILATIGVSGLDELAARVVPAVIADSPDDNGLDALPPPATEHQVLATLAELAARNTVCRSMIGLGYYDTLTPPVIRRNVLENPAGTPPTRPISPRSARGASRHCSTSRPWSPTSPASRSRMRQCSTRRPRRRRR